MKKIFEKFLGKKILILGFGREGQSSYELLRREYPTLPISIADIADLESFDQNVIAGIEQDKNTTLILGERYLENLCIFSSIIKTPGIPYGRELLAAKEKGVEITSQTKIFFGRCKGKIIGVTGTKGKSTTSTLIYQILKEAGYEAYLVGNIENPSLEVLANHNNKNAVFVYELSSHQLSDLKESPHISVVTNIGIDHLDWHKKRESYVAAKMNIVRYQKASDFAILNRENEILKSFTKNTKAKVIYFSKKTLGKKYKEALFLRGEHNLENIAAVVVVAKIFKVNEEIIIKTIKNFRGLEHRLEWAGEIEGVSFYNDSASTNQTSVKAAVNSFIEPISLIMGGYDRGINYDGLADYLSRVSNLKAILLVGQIRDKLRRSLKKAKYKGKILDLDRSSMAKIVKTALANALKGGVVLLSPAAASFDMFKDYKDRGNQFKEAVKYVSKN